MEIEKLSVEEIEERYEEEEDAKAKLRLLALIHRLERRTYQEIGDILRRPFTIIRHRIQKIERDGLNGIYYEKRPGRPSKLEADEMERLKDDLIAGPKAHGYEQEGWTTKLVKKHLEEKYRVKYSARNLRRILKKLGFSPQKPRPPVAGVSYGDAVKITEGKFEGERGRIANVSHSEREATVEVKSGVVPFSVTVDIDEVKPVREKRD